DGPRSPGRGLRRVGADRDEPGPSGPSEPYTVDKERPMPHSRLAGAALAFLALPACLFAAGPPPKKAAGRLRLPEAVEMVLAILEGSGAGRGGGWSPPSQSKYDWKWLARRADANGDGVITRQELKAPRALFDRLDRDGDGKLTAADFDWSGRSPLA